MRTHTGTGLIHPARLLERLGVTEGHHVADIGCGSLGHFVFPSAKRVGADGRVYAVDIQRRALDVIRRAAKEEQLFNIETIWGDADRIGGIRLNEGSVDVALITNTLSSSRRPLDLVKEVARITREHGIALVVDWKLHASAIGPSVEHRVSDTTAQEWFGGGAFELEDSFEAGPYHYALIFRRI